MSIYRTRKVALWSTQKLLYVYFPRFLLSAFLSPDIIVENSLRQ